MLLGSLPGVVRLAAAGRLDEARMSLFHPLGFMLASPVDSVDEALKRFAAEVAEEIADPPGLKPPSLSGADGTAEAVPLQESAVFDEPMSQDRDAGHPALSLQTNTEAGSVEPPTLRKSAKDGAPGLDLLREAQIEDKYDGIRAQLHGGDPGQAGRVALFSRSKEEMTAAFPELVEAFSGLDRPLILDGEVLAWDFANSRALPFSTLQARIGRKKVTDAMRAAVPVVFMAFDLLYADGELLLERPLSERRAALERFAAERPGS